MSSTLAYHPLHPVAHMYGHAEIEHQQQSYSNNPYFADPTFSVDADADSSYYGHAEAPYGDDERGFNSLSSGLGLSQCEDTEDAFRYDRMQDVAISSNPNHQLICPKPTLPPSQLSSDWSSEPHVSSYQPYSEPNRQRYSTSSIQHQNHSPEVQHSFENPHTAVIATPNGNFYPATQAFTSSARIGNYSASIPYHGGNGGYMQQPFLTPSFERGPTQSAYSASVQPTYYPAHQPIPPEQRSSYSELAANLTFMNAQAKAPSSARQDSKPNTQDLSIPKHEISKAITRSATPSRDVKENPYALGFNGPPLTAIGRKVVPDSAPALPLPPDCAVVDTIPPLKTTSKNAGKTRSSRSVNEPRRPSLACTFCRERKIACGRPPTGSPDPTCNQCARRSFRCRYLDSKSTSLVRSRASSKDSTSSLKRK